MPWLTARALLASCFWLSVGAAHAQAASQAPLCTGKAACAGYLAFHPDGLAQTVHFLSTIAPRAEAGQPAPSEALIVIHGHPRDANKTFNAALMALQQTGHLATTVLIAPVFQVPAPADAHCHTQGVPPAQPGDLVWDCSSWQAGLPATNAAPTSFEVLDALVDHVLATWPSVRTVTIAGFSAGAQLVQHAIGFVRPRPPGAVRLRYVVSSPGTWLYFNTVPSAALTSACPNAHDWKYGLGHLPAALSGRGAQAGARYAAADVSYLVGAQDKGAVPGAFYRVLDKSCAAMLQGATRLQRAQAYVQQENLARPAAAARQLAIVPGCAHDVRCVWTSPAGAAALTGLADQAPGTPAP